jgi:AbiV family abortive infection protein
VDLGSVKAAPTPVLIIGAIAAARNTQGLLYDARVLADAGCVPRAYSLAALAVEEAGKAASLVLLTVMPEAVRARAPVGRMLGWHQLKQVQGLVIARVPYSLPDVAPWLAAMPAGELAQFLTTLDVLADEADRLKRRGFYVDVGRGGRIREPSEITETEVLSQLARAGGPQQRWASCSSRSCKPGWLIRSPRRSSSRGRWSVRLPRPETPAPPRLPPRSCSMRSASSGPGGRRKVQRPRPFRANCGPEAPGIPSAGSPSRSLRRVMWVDHSVSS